MADITNLFKAQIKALKLRNKSVDNTPTNILPKKHESDFEGKAKKLVSRV